MFSRRTGWDREPNALSRMLAERAAAGSSTLDLRESRPHHVGLEWDAEFLNDLLRQPAANRFEPDPAGSLDARLSVSRWYSQAGFDLPPENIVLTASTSEAYGFLFKLLCDPGETVLTPRPSYPLFDSLTRLDSVATSSYSLRFHEAWELDVDALAANLPERARAVLTVNPGNPDGSARTPLERQRLFQVCDDRQLAIISDEVFAPFPWREGDEFESVLGSCGPDSPLCFALSGLSKLAGLPQLKLGWIAMGGPSELVGEARERLLWLADSYLSCNTPVQLALPRLLEASGTFRQAALARIRRNIKRITESLAGTGLELLPGSGGWSAMLRLPESSCEETFVPALLKETGTLVQPGYFYESPLAPCVVLSLITPEEDLEEGLVHLVDLARRGSPRGMGAES